MPGVFTKNYPYTRNARYDNNSDKNRLEGRDLAIFLLDEFKEFATLVKNDEEFLEAIMSNKVPYKLERICSDMIKKIER